MIMKISNKFKRLFIVSVTTLSILIAISSWRIVTTANKEDSKKIQGSKPIIESKKVEINNSAPMISLPDFRATAKNVMPSVVFIEAEFKGRERSSSPFNFFKDDDFFKHFFNTPQPEAQKRVGRGSGFIVSKEGHIVTNNHLVENAEKVYVTLNDGRKFDAKIIGSDAGTDIAVIQIEQKEDKKAEFPFLTFGDSDKLDVAEWVMAAGSPLGFKASISVGVVSAKGRTTLELNTYEDFIQTDAAINVGNSGGPLVNTKGEVVGVNAAMATNTGGYIGLGFSIPSNMAKHIMKQLINSGHVIRGFLGVLLQEISDDIAKSLEKSIGLKMGTGALVAEVVKDSPADLAGLKNQDVILKYNGEPVESVRKLQSSVSITSPGTMMTLTVNRQGEIIDIPIKIGSSEEYQKKIGIGIKVKAPTKEERQKFGEAAGVIIEHVNPESHAAKQQIKPGLLIMSVDLKSVNTPEEFEKAIEKAINEKRKHIVLYLKYPDGRYLYMTIRFSNKDK